jgi:peptidoglycan/xylan/chitin deacetylase (PgdA/CDA1 family)
MTETLETNEDLLDPEVQDLERLEKEIRNTWKLEKSDQQKNPYKEMIEKQKGPITHWNKENPEISITFDDGYGSNRIRHILDTLKWSWIKATFFILWECLRKTPNLWKEAIEDWHQICCHTFSHIYLSDKSDITSINTWLNKDIKISERVNNVKSILWEQYFEKIKAQWWEWFPQKINSDVLLETEILMREESIKKTLGEDYLQKFKQNCPFFRFPWGCGDKRPKNIAVLKKLWYLSIGWSDDFRRSKEHMSIEEMRTMDIPNWSIPLFHFKEQDYKYVDAYIENMKNRNKTSHEVSRIIK